MRFDMFKYVFGMFMSLVRPLSLPAALRRPQKKHPFGILENVSWVFCRFCFFSLVRLLSLPAALRRPQKKHPLEFWSVYPLYLYIITPLRQKTLNNGFAAHIWIQIW